MKAKDVKAITDAVADQIRISHHMTRDKKEMATLARCLSLTFQRFDGGFDRDAFVTRATASQKHA